MTRVLRSLLLALAMTVGMTGLSPVADASTGHWSATVPASIWPCTVHMRHDQLWGAALFQWEIGRGCDTAGFTLAFGYQTLWGPVQWTAPMSPPHPNTVTIGVTSPTNVPVQQVVDLWTPSGQWYRFYYHPF